ncbi:MAG: hypothetical protein NC453_24815 [Muribaculum sp.]|nr:hypothetical protein [Muribaculum sp.]
MPEDELSVRGRNVEVKIDLSLHGKKAVCPHRSKQIHEEFMNAPMVDVDELGNDF